MKKMYKYILIITIMIFGIVGEVRANDELNGCVSAGTCELLCSYKSDEGNAYIYKMNKSYDGKNVTFTSSFSWNKGKKKVAYMFNESGYSNIDENGEYNIVSGVSLAGKTAFIDGDLISDYESFTCPQKVYKNDSAGEEICFDNDDGYCKDIGAKKFKNAMSNVEIISKEKAGIKDTKLTAKNAKKKVQEYFNKNNDKSEMLELCVFNNNSIVEGDADQKFVVTLKDKFRYFSYRNTGGIESFGEFVKKADNTSVNSIDIKFSIWSGSCLAMSKIYSYTNYSGNIPMYTLTDKSISAALETEYLNDGNPFNSQSDTGEQGGTGTGDDSDDPATCEDLLGENLRNEINSYLLYIKVAVPIIIIVMGSLDFGKAFISSDEDSMKKAQKKFIMRLIIGMVIFFLPALINILLNIANQVWGFSKGTCGITF